MPEPEPFGLAKTVRTGTHYLAGSPAEFAQNFVIPVTRGPREKTDFNPPAIGLLQNVNTCFRVAIEDRHASPEGFLPRMYDGRLDCRGKLIAENIMYCHRWSY